MRKILVFAALFLIFPAAAAFAVPALERPFTVKQPDGSVIEIVQRGDERAHWTESANGRWALVRDEKSGWWNYAEVKDGRLASLGVHYVPGKRAPKKAVKGFRPTPVRPACGEPSALSEVRGEALVTLRSGISQETYEADIDTAKYAMRMIAERAASRAGAEVVQLFAPVAGRTPVGASDMIISAHFRSTAPDEPTAALIARLKNDPSVLAASPNGVSRPMRLNVN